MTSIVIYFVLQIILIFILFCIFLELFQDFAFGKVPFVPTSIKIIVEIIKQIEQDKPKVIYDLGAGDSRFLIRVSKKFPEAKVIGFEYSLWPFLLGKIKLLLSRSSAKLKFKNFFKQNLSQADIIFCFLGDKQMRLLEKKFERELKKGTTIICNTFILPHWQLKKQFAFSHIKNHWHKIYFYQK